MALAEKDDVTTPQMDMSKIVPGDRVRLADDDWDGVGHEFVLIDPEPVPGSFQCIVADNGEPITVSMARLRRF